MSVLIEAVTLVVRRQRFDSTFPGGAHTLFSALSSSENASNGEPRYACADDPHLVALSFERADFAIHAIALLKSAGLKGPIDTLPDLADFMLVDATVGPDAQVSWLGFSTHEDGFCYAWDVDYPIGAVAGPAAWMRAGRYNDKMNRSALVDESERLMLLSSENGVKTYLDLRTGALTKDLMPPTPNVPSPGSPDSEGRFGDGRRTSSIELTSGERLNHLLYDAVNELGWGLLVGGPGLFAVPYKTERAEYSCRFLAFERSNVISCSVQSPLMIPLKNRRRVLEYVSRLNCQIMLGSFELNLDSGALHFRAALTLSEQDPTPKIAAEIANIAAGMMDRFFPVVMEIVAGQTTVMDAIGLNSES